MSSSKLSRQMRMHSGKKKKNHNNSIHAQQISIKIHRKCGAASQLKLNDKMKNCTETSRSNIFFSAGGKNEIVKKKKNDCCSRRAQRLRSKSHRRRSDVGIEIEIIIIIVKVKFVNAIAHSNVIST